MRFVLGDGDDEVSLRRNINTGLDEVDVTFETGPGEDEVDLDGRGRFLVLTGSENDLVHFDTGSGTQEAATVDTGGGDDTVELVGNANVGDAVDGGPGDADHVSYAGRPVTPNLRIRSNPNQPSGRVGTLANRLGENDRLANFEVLEGHSGRSTITGGPGDDTLIGGAGRDGLRGKDGDDTLNTNDGVLDLVAVCGLDGNDVAIIDSVDPNPNNIPVLGLTRNCETVMRQPHGQRPLLILTRAHERRDAVSVRARCVRRNGCRGSLVVTNRRRRAISGTERFSIGNGESETVRLSLDVGRLPEGAQVIARTRDGKGRVHESSTVL
jgi:Ca2+-binding RTX toxin-like protein